MLMSEAVKFWARFRLIINEKSLTNFGQGFASVNE